MLLKKIKIYLFFLVKVPMILWCFPRIKTLTNQKTILDIPLTFLTRNHLKSMYFGALMVGVDLACGLLAFHLIEQVDSKVSLIFKDVQASFLKRAEGAVRFECDSGEIIQAMIDETIKTQERVSQSIPVRAYLRSAGECVAEFSITLSLKLKS